MARMRRALAATKTSPAIAAHSTRNARQATVSTSSVSSSSGR